MSKLVLMGCAVLALTAASEAARATVLYDNTAGAAVGPGSTPGYESASYSGFSPAEEFTATGTGTVSSFSFEFSNPSANNDPLTVSLWTTNSTNIAFQTELGSWNFNSEIGSNPFTQTVDISGGPTLTSGVLYGIELSTSSTTTSTGWLSNSNVDVPYYSVCNVAFFCGDPNGQTPTLNSTYYVGEVASGPQYLFTINGVSVAGVPEPGAWVMLLVGLGGLGTALRMARRSSRAVPIGV